MKKLQYTLLLLSSLMLFSCEKIAMNPKPEESKVAVFNEYARICIDKYALSDVNKVDLKHLCDSLRPFINEDLSNKQLFNYMSVITYKMVDAHSNLKSFSDNLSTFMFWFAGYPSANNAFITGEYYYGPNANPNVQTIGSEESSFKIRYGFLPQDSTIGYITITSFSMEVSNAEIERMMDYLKDARGIVIDVRGNIGGYIELASRIASYFTKETKTVGTDYIKTGPGANDYTASEIKLKPSGYANTFVKPVAVLYDKVTFSSASLFSTIMRATDNCITLGQSYGGGTGNIIDGLLLNGWKYTIVVSNFKDNAGKITANGVEPDFPMVIDPADKDKDAIIEKAIVELKKK